MNKLIILIGIIVGGLAGFMVYGKLQATEAQLVPTTYLTYSQDSDSNLRAGAAIQESDLSIIRVINQGDIFGLDTQLVPDTIANRTWLVGKQLNATIPPGRVLTFDLFEDLNVNRLDAQIKMGMRAFTFNVSQQSSLANSIIPGNRVDILGILETGADEGTRTVMILEDVLILGTGNALTQDQYESGRKNYRTITIELAPERAAQLAADINDMSGDPLILLRNQCDTAEPLASCGQ